jgi:hypothetical protein
MSRGLQKDRLRLVNRVLMKINPLLGRVLSGGCLRDNIILKVDPLMTIKWQARVYLSHKSPFEPMWFYGTLYLWTIQLGGKTKSQGWPGNPGVLNIWRR